jgi:parvulin-like peptidyl-prolyl isomerase
MERNLLRSAGQLFILFAFALTTAFQELPDHVAMVGGDPVPTTLFQQRVRLARWTTAQQLLQVMQTYGPDALTDPGSPYNGQYKNLSDNATFAQQVLDSLITVKLVQHEAAARGITVTDDDVQNQINAFFGYAPNATPQPPQPGETPQPPLNPTEMAQAFQEERDNYFGQAGDIARMGQADVIATFAEQALQIKVYEALTKNVPTQGQQVKVRHILVDSLEKANALLAQIQGGASFADVAKANSQDATSAVNGGDLGWSPHGVYFPEFEDAIWKVTPGTLIGPIKTPVGFHLILVEGREVRPLTEADLIRERDAVYRQWLQQARDKANVQIVDNWQALIPAEPTLKALGLP